MSENVELETGAEVESNTEGATVPPVETEKPDEQPSNETTSADDGGKVQTDENGAYGSPEQFDYKDIELPEGIRLDEELVKEFNPIAKKLNLSQSSANELVSLGVKLAQKQAGNLPAIMQQVQQAKVAQYQQALNTDKEIGNGDRSKMNAYLDVADKGYTAFATDEVKQALAEVGLNYHPAIVKMFHRIGELVGDDKIYGTRSPVTSQDPADILYNN